MVVDVKNFSSIFVVSTCPNSSVLPFFCYHCLQSTMPLIFFRLPLGLDIIMSYHVKIDAFVQFLSFCAYYFKILVSCGFIKYFLFCTSAFNSFLDFHFLEFNE